MDFYAATEAAYWNGYEKGRANNPAIVRCEDCKHQEKCTMWVNFVDGSHALEWCSFGERGAE